MADETKPVGQHVTDANDHAKTKGDGSRAALPAQPAPKRAMQRNIKVTVRAPFLPAHHAHARLGLKPGRKP